MLVPNAGFPTSQLELPRALSPSSHLARRVRRPRGRALRSHVAEHRMLTRHAHGLRPGRAKQLVCNQRPTTPSRSEFSAACRSPSGTGHLYVLVMPFRSDMAVSSGPDPSISQRVHRRRRSRQTRKPGQIAPLRQRGIHRRAQASAVTCAYAQSNQRVSSVRSDASTVAPHQTRRPGGASRYEPMS